MRPKVVHVREHLILHRQEGPARVHQVQAGQPVFPRYRLRAQMFFYGEGIVRTALHGRIVGDNHALATAHQPDPRDDSGGGRLVLVHLVRGQRRQFQKGGARVQEPVYSIAHQHLPLLALTLSVTGAAALACLGQASAQRFR